MRNYFIGEWISGSVCMYQAHMLVQGYGNDREVPI